MIDPPGWKGDVGAPNAASGTQGNANALTARKCLRVNGDDKRGFPITSGTSYQWAMDSSKTESEFYAAGLPLFWVRQKDVTGAARRIRGDERGRVPRIASAGGWVDVAFTG